MTDETRPTLQRLIYSAPFGNYLGGPHITSTLGTFTRQHRAGFLKRLWRIALTVRYSPLFDAWVNRLGLPNPGIESALAASARRKLPDRLLSIHGFDTGEWHELIAKVAEVPDDTRPLGVELNVSCPNVKDDPLDHASIFRAAREQLSSLVIVKLPPVSWHGIAEAAVEAGVTHLHCCNTLPVKRGGLSGKPLQSVSLRVVEEVANRWPDVTIIGGGGITGLADIDRYRNAGATHFAVGSALFFPWMGWRMRGIAKQLARTEVG